MKCKKIDTKTLSYLEHIGMDEVLRTIISQEYTGDDIKSFLNTDFSYGNYKELLDIDKGTELLLNTMKTNTFIAIVVDYDADGTSSGAISDIFFKEYLNYSNFIVIYNERSYGNGINQTIVDQLVNLKTKHSEMLLLTADHGSSDDERFKILKEHKIDILVTDHHEVPTTGNLKHVDVFINPQRDGGNFNTSISGCTVLFYLFLNTYCKYKNISSPTKDDELELLLPFVALTIITDQMNVSDKLNRDLYRKGIKLMVVDKGVWHKLITSLRLSRNIDSNSIAFGIGGLINTGKRMNCASLVGKVFSSPVPGIMQRSIDELIKLNQERKVLQNELTSYADKQIQPYMKRFSKTIVSVLSEGQGVAGIVASMLSNRYNKPAFVFAKIGDKISGSGRSVGDLNLLEVFENFKATHPDLWIRGGGHKGAAGVGIYYKDLLSFIESFETVCKDFTVDSEVYYNYKLTLDQINLDFYDKIYSLDPYGRGFTNPRFMTEVTVDKIIKIGKKKEHAIIKVTVQGKQYDLMFFYFDNSLNSISAGDRIEAVFTISRRLEYRKESVSTVIENLRRIG